MKNLKKILALILLVISFSRISYSQEWEEQAIGSVGTEDFINLNHGWTVVRGSQGFTVFPATVGVPKSLLIKFEFK